MDDFESDHCPVCHKPVAPHTDTEIPDEVREHLKEHIYKPGEDIRKVALDQDQQQQREQIRKFLEETRPPSIELENAVNNGD